MRNKFTKLEKSWIMYDWANSAYSIAITTAILPLLFKASYAETFKFWAISEDTVNANSTAIWGYANSFASLLVAILAPFLGAIADYKDRKKRFFTFFVLLGVFFTGALAFVPFGSWEILIALYILTVVGFAGANVFYDSFLVDVTSDERMDRVSTSGYAFGYIGSCIPFVIGLSFVLFADKIGIDTTTGSNIAIVITALWWGLFTIPFFRHVKQVHYLENVEAPVKQSFDRIIKTIKSAIHYKHIFLFLLAYFFYIDGVNTVIKMAGVYGRDVGIEGNDLIIILLYTQIIAFPFALMYGKLAHKFSNRNMLVFAIITYIFAVSFAFFMDSALDFWILSTFIASAQGGIQALSRSYYGKLIPKERSNEFFGLYNIFGKFAAILGPFIIAFTTTITGNSRFGILSLIPLFIIGLILLIKTPHDKGNQETI